MKNFIPAFLVLALTILSQNLFAQDTESYTKVANRLVELINAADYSGVENLFNKNMSTALPLDKATGFFAGMTGRFGKIQKLDEPKHSAGWTVFPAHFERGMLDMLQGLDDERDLPSLPSRPSADLTLSQHINAQDTESYTKVANRLVKLINAGDYAGIQTNFN